MILPVWNGSAWLGEAIASILGQTHSNLELVVVDDGSTDDSVRIARLFAARDVRVAVHEGGRRGIVTALNHGIERAHGTLIARMDADDVAVSERLAKQAAFLEANPRCAVVGSAVSVMDETGAEIGAIRFPRDHEEIERALLGEGSGALAHPAVMMRTDAVRAVGGYREELYPSEDLDLWLRLAEVGTLANLDDVLLRYRRHRDSIGIRERRRQTVTGRRVIQEARTRRGMPPLRPERPAAHTPPAAVLYHNDCARIALRAGHRGAALKHSAASLSSSPLQWAPYAVAAACALPASILLRLYGAIRARRT